MKKLKFFAAGLALVFAVCSAFTSTKPPNTVKYEVTDTDGAYYVLGEDLTAQVENSDYECNKSSSICSMDAQSTAIVQRNNETEVPISAATTQQGNFLDLQN